MRPLSVHYKTRSSYNILGERGFGRRGVLFEHDDLLLDVAGEPLPGFSLAECEPLTGDCIRFVMRGERRIRASACGCSFRGSAARYSLSSSRTAYPNNPQSAVGTLLPISVMLSAALYRALSC